MEIDKKNYLVTGTLNDKTREKIRLKLRMIFNNYKKCIIGTTEIKAVPGLGYSFEQDGFKHLFFVYKSSSFEKVRQFKIMFQEMYQNELGDFDFEESASEEPKPGEKGPYVMYIIGKSKKRVF